MIEVELKYPLSNEEQLKHKLEQLGAKPLATKLQQDTYFDNSDGEIAAKDQVLRIRSSGESNFLTFKGPKQSGQAKVRRELEVKLSSKDAANGLGEILRSIGYVKEFTVSKKRQRLELNWQGQRVLVCLDSVDGLGQFAELELVVAEGEVESAKSILSGLADELGLSGSITDSYLELLLNVSGE